MAALPQECRVITNKGSRGDGSESYDKTGQDNVYLDVKNKTNLYALVNWDVIPTCKVKEDVEKRIGKRLRVLGEGMCDIALLYENGKVVKYNKEDLFYNSHVLLDIGFSVSLENIHIRKPDSVILFPFVQGLRGKCSTVAPRIVQECETLRNVMHSGFMESVKLARKCFAYQLCSALVYMHEVVNVIHGDLSISNVMLESFYRGMERKGDDGLYDFTVKLTDFGSLQFMGMKEDDITTAPFKSPETVFDENRFKWPQYRPGKALHCLLPSEYSYGIDVWALGIIMCLLVGMPEQTITSDKVEELERIWETKHGFKLIDSSWDNREMFANGTPKLARIDHVVRQRFVDEVKVFCHQGIDEAAFILDCLSPNPGTRLSASDLLGCSYFDEVRGKYKTRHDMCMYSKQHDMVSDLVYTVDERRWKECLDILERALQCCNAGQTKVMSIDLAFRCLSQLETVTNQTVNVIACGSMYISSVVFDDTVDIPYETCPITINHDAWDRMCVIYVLDLLDCRLFVRQVLTAAKSSKLVHISELSVEKMYKMYLPDV